MSPSAQCFVWGFLSGATCVFVAWCVWIQILKNGQGGGGWF